MSNSPLLQSNPNDPLNPRIKEHKELYGKLCQVASGFPMDAVTACAFNLLIQGIRQTYGNRNAAAARIDDLCGQLKQAVDDHYDSVTGKRKNIFAFDQRVVMPMFYDKDKFGKEVK